MKGPTLSGTLTLMLLFSLAGCTHDKGGPVPGPAKPPLPLGPPDLELGSIFAENGELTARPAVKNGQKLTWKSDGTNVKHFWIVFDDPTFCKEGATSESQVIQGTSTQVAKCTVNQLPDGPYPYRVYKTNPNAKPKPIKPKKEHFVQHCEGCT